MLVMLLQGCGGEDRAPTAPAPTADTGSGAAADAGSRTPSPPGAAVFFIEPIDGATVASPVTVKFGISGMSVAPAGDSTPATGHHHLLIDAELTDESLPVPNSDQHLHFGKGQTETAVELVPGEHQLQLVLGDANHVPHDPPVMSQRITITVE
ncbi:MAG: DUF4399 domain-containing protein [Gammaproteobacteria bacterium]|nr:DUF4399 domain-containing protein [Gammaproteobacteria bacterium]